MLCHDVLSRYNEPNISLNSMRMSDLQMICNYSQIILQFVQFLSHYV